MAIPDTEGGEFPSAPSTVRNEKAEHIRSLPTYRQRGSTLRNPDFTLEFIHAAGRRAYGLLRLRHSRNTTPDLGIS